MGTPASKPKENGVTRTRRRTVLLAGLMSGATLGLLAAALGLVEIGLRVAERGERRASTDHAAPVAQNRFLACEHDSALGWVFAAGSRGDFTSGRYVTPVEANAWGLRNREVNAADSACTRILVLGDSHAFGWGVPEEESFPRQLEALARQRNGDRVEVIDAGIPGYGVYQQCVMLERLTRSVRIDIVVSTFSLANDPVDDLRVSRYAPDRMLEYSADPGDPHSWGARLAQRSRLMELLHRRSLPLQFHLANASRGAIRQAQASLERLAVDCDARGIQLLLVTVPRRVEIKTTGLQGWAARLMTRRARHMQEQFALQRRLPLVDVGPPLLAAERDGSAYLADDPHWNGRGHRAVAEAIFAAIPPAWLRHRGAGALSRLASNPAATAVPETARQDSK